MTIHVVDDGRMVRESSTRIHHAHATLRARARNSHCASNARSVKKIAERGNATAHWCIRAHPGAGSSSLCDLRQRTTSFDAHPAPSSPEQQIVSSIAAF